MVEEVIERKERWRWRGRGCIDEERERGSNGGMSVYIGMGNSTNEESHNVCLATQTSMGLLAAHKWNCNAKWEMKRN